MNATLGLLPSYFQNSADQAIYYHNQTNERNYRAFSSFYGTVSWLCFVLGVMLNFLLIWLIIKKTHGEMKAYSKILLQTCVLDLYTLTMAVVVQPIYIMLEGNNIMLQNGFFREASQPLNFIVGELWFLATTFRLFPLLSRQLSVLYFISYMTVPVPWIPVLNPLITLLLVKQYRMIVFGGGKALSYHLLKTKTQLELRKVS
uniref:G-protein coupled receptors family 1 profile domain-containing protein n=1 Tax=Ditylenchus dipsaci TaxID=166011 RepID=A0A915DQ31_9BILA